MQKRDDLGLVSVAPVSNWSRTVNDEGHVVRRTLAICRPRATRSERSHLGLVASQSDVEDLLVPTWGPEILRYRLIHCEDGPITVGHDHLRITSLQSRWSVGRWCLVPIRSCRHPSDPTELDCGTNVCPTQVDLGQGQNTGVGFTQMKVFLLEHSQVRWEKFFVVVAHRGDQFIMVRVIREISGGTAVVGLSLKSQPFYA